MAIRRITFKAAMEYLNNNKGGVLPLGTLGKHYLEVLPSDIEGSILLVAHTGGHKRLCPVHLEEWTGEHLSKKGEMLNLDPHSGDQVTSLHLFQGEVCLYDCGRISIEDPRLTRIQRLLHIRVEKVDPNSLKWEFEDTRRGGTPNAYGRYTTFHGDIKVPYKKKGVLLSEEFINSGMGSYKQRTLLCTERCIEELLESPKGLRELRNWLSQPIPLRRYQRFTLEGMMRLK